MKKIVAQWVKTGKREFNNVLYDKELMVIESNHPRFIQGSRFDFGFLNIATDEGYICEIHPLAKPKTYHKKTSIRKK